MPAHVRTNDGFIVTLWRGEDVLDATTAETGERALKAAIVLLAGQDSLQGGDKLTVTETKDNSHLTDVIAA
jgi:hypothetical protein